MKYDDQNIFAKILRGELPAEKIFEDEVVVAIMDIMPRADGHMLVLPKNPCRNILDANISQLNVCIELVQRLAKASFKAFNAHGITIQQFSEAAGGQEVFHLHFHVLPRHNGVSLRPPGKMEDPAILKENCRKIIKAISD